LGLGWETCSRDNREDRKKILAARWPAEDAVMVFDELHKYKNWRGWIKGEYDKHGDRVHFLITGSARMDIYRKGGDSLQGRYHSNRLHGFLSNKIPCPISTEKFHKARKAIL